jgi:hypothetical protein
MIECRPTNAFSWSFDIEGDGHRGTVDMRRLREQGSITADGAVYEVRKHGVVSREWSLEQYGQTVATARQTSVFRRTFEVKGAFGTFTLRARRFFGRTFTIETSNQPVAAIKRPRFFSRRATIEVERKETPFAALVFMFWLVLVTWRRARRRN